MRFPSSSLFLLPIARVETRFSVLSMQFGAGHSRANSLLCYTIFVRMPEMYLACWIMLRFPFFTCSLVRAIEEMFCLLSLLSSDSCLDDGWGKYSCILYCHQGAWEIYILSIVQPCHVSTKHLLADTFSCICILLSELCCVLLHRSAASHEYVQINIWR